MRTHCVSMPSPPLQAKMLTEDGHCDAAYNYKTTAHGEALDKLCPNGIDICGSCCVCAGPSCVRWSKGVRRGGARACSTSGGPRVLLWAKWQRCGGTSRCLVRVACPSVVIGGRVATLGLEAPRQRRTLEPQPPSFTPCATLCCAPATSSRRTVCLQHFWASPNPRLCCSTNADFDNVGGETLEAALDRVNKFARVVSRQSQTQAVPLPCMSVPGSALPACQPLNFVSQSDD